MSKITRRNFLKVSGVAAAAAALTACGGSSSTASSAASGAASSEAASTAAKLDKIKVAVPNDTTNEARALTLLEKNGFFKLKADAGLTATKNDIEENPLNVNVDEVEAAQVPNVLQDEDYAVINSNYAISAGLDPMTDALAMEDGTSAYVNVLVCKEGNEEEPKIKALVAALQSQQVKDFMTESYGGAVVSVVEDPTDGYDPSIDYDALNGETVSCAATPAPHCEILEVCKQILADKGITLDIQEYDDYVIPNTIVEDGQCDTNYFQHQPYLDNFNEEKGTHLVSVAGIHVEPMGHYGGQITLFLRKNQYHMNVIWHYHIFIHTHTGKMSGNILYSLCGHLSDDIWFSCRAKHTLFMMRTYGHKIIIFSSIIIILQTGIFARA